MSIKHVLLVGKTPTHIEREDLLDYFLYVFEFSWNNVAHESKKSQLRKHFETESIKFVSDIHALPKEKLWWLYVLIALKDIAETDEVEYGKATILHFLNKIEKLSEEQLVEYANEIQHGFYYELPESLVIRPLELVALGNKMAEEDPYLKFFFEKKEEMIKALTKHLRQKDVDSGYFNNITLNDRKLTRKFSSFWDTYYEIFLNYFLSMYDFQMIQTEIDESEEHDVLREMLFIFFIASIENKLKIEPLIDDFFDIMVDILEVGWEEDEDESAE